MKRCIIFIRVSTIQQDYERQRIELIKYAESKGYNDYIVIAHKESAIKLKEQERQGIEELKDIIKRDSSIDSIFIWEISRLARREDVLHNIKTFFIENKINLYIWDKRYQLLNDDGSVNSETELLFTLYSYFASQEMKLKIERSKSGKTRLKKEGKYVGGKLLFGFTTTKDNIIIPNEEELNIVKWIFDTYLNTDISLRQLGIECQRRGIIKTDNKRSAASWLKFMVTNYGYCGEHKYYKYPQILPKEFVDKAIEKMKGAARLPRYTDNIYWCKSILYNTNYNRNYIANKTDAKYTTRDPHHQLDINLFDSFIWHLVKNFYYPLSLRVNTNNINKKLDDELISIEMKLTTINNKLDKLAKELIKINTLYIKERLSETEYETRYNDNINSKAILSDSKRLLEENRLTILSKKENVLKRPGLLDINSLTNGLDDIKIYDLIHQLIKRIYITLHEDHIQIIVEDYVMNIKEEYKLIKNKIYQLNDYEEWEKMEFEIKKRFTYIKRKKDNNIVIPK